MQVGLLEVGQARPSDGLVGQAGSRVLQIAGGLITFQSELAQMAWVLHVVNRGWSPQVHRISPEQLSRLAGGVCGHITPPEPPFIYPASANGAQSTGATGATRASTGHVFASNHASASLDSTISTCAHVR